MYLIVNQWHNLTRDVNIEELLPVLMYAELAVFWVPYNDIPCIDLELNLLASYISFLSAFV